MRDVINRGVIFKWNTSLELKASSFQLLVKHKGHRVGLDERQ